jgi:hypothetical protein
LVGNGLIDVGKSTNDVFKEEDANCPTHDDIIVVILVQDDTDGVLCRPTSPEIYIYIYIYCLHNMSISSLIKQQIAHVFQ